MEKNSEQVEVHYTYRFRPMGSSNSVRLESTDGGTKAQFILSKEELLVMLVAIIKNDKGFHAEWKALNIPSAD